jgi:hypothetical protein
LSVWTIALAEALQSPNCKLNELKCVLSTSWCSLYQTTNPPLMSHNQSWEKWDWRERCKRIVGCPATSKLQIVFFDVSFCSSMLHPWSNQYEQSGYELHWQGSYKSAGKCIAKWKLQINWLKVSFKGRLHSYFHRELIHNRISLAFACNRGEEEAKALSEGLQSPNCKLIYLKCVHVLKNA